MKLLIFAQKPPPFHGQSFMVQLALEKLGGDARNAVKPWSRTPEAVPEIECYHVDARLADDFHQLGIPSAKKLFRLLKYCFQAIWCRFRYGIPNLYFVPAQTVRSSIVRDWMALAICRPFFRTLIYHWHAGGLGNWLETTARPWQRRITLTIMGRPDMSLVLLPFGRHDAEAFVSKRIAIVANGIPDPCPQFDMEIAPQRRARAQARKKLLAGQEIGAEERMNAGGDPGIFRVLFLSLCHRSKGLFDTIEAVAIANRRRGPAAVCIELDVAGPFLCRKEQAEFETRLREPDLNADGPIVRYHGFVSGEEKKRLFVTSDCLCFPTYYYAESFGLVLIEAMAFGLPLITTRWRGLDKLLPPGYAGVVDPQAPDQIAAGLLSLRQEDYDDSLRRLYLRRYTDEVFARDFRLALLKLR